MLSQNFKFDIILVFLLLINFFKEKNILYIFFGEKINAMEKKLKDLAYWVDSNST